MEHLARCALLLNTLVVLHGRNSLVSSDDIGMDLAVAYPSSDSCKGTLRHRKTETRRVWGSTL